MFGWRSLFGSSCVCFKAVYATLQANFLVCALTVRFPDEAVFPGVCHVSCEKKPQKVGVFICPMIHADLGGDISRAAAYWRAPFV